VNWIFDAELLNFTKDCKVVINFFNSHHKEAEKFHELQRAAGITKQQFRLPGETRWGSIQAMFTSLLTSSEVLVSHVSRTRWLNVGNPKLKEAKRVVHEIIRRENDTSEFEDLLHFALKILEPIDEIIVETQSNNLPLSRAYQLFDELAGKYHRMNILSEPQKRYIQAKVAHYWQMVYGDATGVAYLLDPKYCGEALSEHLESELINFICNFHNDEDDDVEAELTAFLTKWREHKRQGSTEYIRIQNSNEYHPRNWWIINQKFYPRLFLVAEKVFNFPASSAATERSFSADSFIHSKLRNRLLPDKVKKCSIYGQMQFMYCLQTQTGRCT